MWDRSASSRLFLAVNYDYICKSTFIPVFLWQNLFGLSYVKFCIGDAIDSGIVPCIIDSLWNNLYAIDLFCFLCQEERNGSNPAVQIPDGLLSLQICIFQCQTIQFFLSAQDLHERKNNGEI